MNSKPTSRRDSHLSNEYAEVNQEGYRSRSQSIVNEGEEVDPQYIFMESDEVKQLLEDNRKQIASTILGKK